MIRPARFCLLAILAAALAGAAADVAPAKKPAVTPLERVSALVQPSIVYIEATFTGRVHDKYNGGNVRNIKRGEARSGRVFSVTASCTGFFVNPDGYVGTAGHCVDPKGSSIKSSIVEQAISFTSSCGCYFNGTPSRSFMLENFEARGTQRAKLVVAYGVSAAGLETGKALPGRVLGFRSFTNGDVALVKINATNLPALLLLTSDVTIGQRIVAVGYPASVDYVTDNTFDPSFKDGTISSKKTIEGGKLEVYEISAAVSGGMSGGPTVGLGGGVIGINSFGISGETQAFNFVTPSQELKDVMTDKGVPNRIGSLNSTYREGLNAYFDGDRSEAIAKFDEVLAVVPNHELAQQFKTKALQLPKESSGFPIWLLILIVVGALVLLGAVLAVLLRRRRQAVPAAAGPAAGSAPAAAPAQPAAPSPAAARAAVSPPPPAPELPAPAPAAGSEPALVFKQGSLAGKRVAVASELVLGREGVDVVIEDDPEVSRRHASVRPVDGRLEIADLGSANGTYVNGSRIREATVLSDGDVVRVGQTSLLADVPTRAPATVIGQQPGATVVTPRGEDPGR